MSLPPAGTNSRRIINLLRGVTSRSPGAIVKLCSDISKPAIQKILAEQIEAGNVILNYSGYRLSAKGIAKFQAEEAATHSEYKDNFKPLNSALFIKVRGSREGSNDFAHGVIKSKHF